MENVACYKEAVKISPTNKISLIYGLNGSGKSTISNYLYNREDIKFSCCKIKEDTDNEILVYNQLFLQDYFYEEDSLKGIFTLSKENKEVLKEIDYETNNLEEFENRHNDLADKKKSINDQINEIKNEAILKVWEIKQKYTNSNQILNYCLEGLKRSKDKLFNHLTAIDIPIVEPAYTIDMLNNEVAALQGEKAHKIDEIEQFDISCQQIEENSIFKKVIVGSQEGTIAEFINELGNSDWVRTGLSYLSKDVDPTGLYCPFCQQKTLNNELVQSIKNVFDDSYDRDIEKLTKYKNEYTDAESELKFKSIDEFIVVDNSLSEKWQSTINEIKNNYQQNKLLIDSKIKSPSSSVSLRSNKSLIETLNNLINDINELIKTHNDKLDNKEESLKRIKIKFWNLMRWKYNQTIELLTNSIDKLRKDEHKLTGEIQVISGKIHEIKSSIVELRKKTVNIEEAITNINNGLSEIGAVGFSVIKHSDYLYRVQRANENSDAFHTLSEGEKTVISFLYFLELCKGQSSAASSPKKKVVVIDDPISSLSHIYVFNIGQLIKRVIFNSNKFEQIFVLTHSLYFFYELTYMNKDKRKQKQNLYRIVKNSTWSNIVPMKYEEIQNDYQSYWSTVKNENSPPALIANCMRNIIEYFFNFVQKKDFSNVFQNQTLSSDKFQAFSRYMNRESHSLGQNIFDIKEFDYSAFKEGLRLVFDECGYSDHYNVMMK